MSKYIKLEDAINKMDEWFCEPYTPTELLSDLPTIEVSDKADRPFEYFEGYEDGKAECDNCIWNVCNYNKIDFEVSEDCISREWLVNHFNDIVEHYEMRIKRVKRYGKKIAYDPSEQIGYWKDEIAVCKHFIKEIEDAPSVVPICQKNRQVERAEGEWVTEKGSYEIICSNCESEAFSEYGEWFKSDYCPHCGAKMKG